MPIIPMPRMDQALSRLLLRLDVHLNMKENNEFSLKKGISMTAKFSGTWRQLSITSGKICYLLSVN